MERLIITFWIAWILAGVSMAGLVISWFVSAYRELKQAKQSVENAIQQIRLHIDGHAQVCGGQYEAAAANSLNVSRLIFREAVKNYETVRHKPVNRLPALLLGYGDIPEEDGL